MSACEGKTTEGVFDLLISLVLQILEHLRDGAQPGEPEDDVRVRREGLRRPRLHGE